MCRSGRSTRDLFSGLACLFCISLLVSMASHGATPRIEPPVAALTVPSSMAKHLSGMDLDPFLSRKRRVPNGADPIHNRYDTNFMGMKPEREDTTNLMRTNSVSSLLDMETQLLLVAPSSSTWPTLIAAEALIFLSIPALSLTNSQCEWPDLVISEIELRSVGRADRSLTRCSMHEFTLVNDS
ncbi:hypothetical protein C4D60_Mb04t29420 [Musa balbisiana]|uniref:Uncharacterized protein n=1 Tax=Musa balbisiana TaxID=52838 RepID=A0A4V4HA43_MUSBA|nr:hypothetical protein C4D60_Mb04t29420 [Musa balbisiana]